MNEDLNWLHPTDEHERQLLHHVPGLDSRRTLAIAIKASATRSPFRVADGRPQRSPVFGPLVV